MQRSCVRKNYRKRSGKQGIHLHFRGAKKTIDKNHVFMTFTVSTSGKHLENVAFAPSGEELFRKTRYTLAFS